MTLYRGTEIEKMGTKQIVLILHCPALNYFHFVSKFECKLGA